MTATAGPAPQGGLPGWVAGALARYLDHVEAGRPLRRIAAAAGCPASTVLRQVRRIETRRDDPLFDEALARLARLYPTSRKEPDAMTAALSDAPGLPDDTTLAREARRLLRRLAEPGACLAVAPGMEKAVIVRETEDGRAVRTAVLDQSVAQAFALKDWIAAEPAEGRVARHRITQAGRSALKRLLAEDAAEKAGLAEAAAPFADQHRDWDSRALPGDGGRRGGRIRYNAAESPLSALSRRRGKDGRPFLDEALVAAGERLREDFELAQMGPRVTQNWDRFLTGGDRGAFRPERGGHGPEAARDRVMGALADLGPGLGDVVLRCCCFLEGLEQAEKRMGWSARSGKIVLRIALQRLKRHYEGLGEAAGLIG